jgi:hypothetical protein
VLAADIAGNGVQNALESVVARNLPLFLEFKQEENGMSFDFFEGQPL